MLTESEKDWLKRRCMVPTPFCGWCMKYALCCSPQYKKCPIITAYLNDALEFEGRVVAKLAKKMLEPNRYPCRGGFPPLGCMRDWSDLTGPMAVHCEDCILREVRLQVEEEMYNEKR